MSKSRHTEAQIISVLKQVEAGVDGRGCCANARCVSKPTIYTWKAKYAGMDVSEPKSSSIGVTRTPD